MWKFGFGMTMRGTDVMKWILMIALWCGWSGPVRAEIVPPESKPLASFPLADRVWLGTYGGEVEVNPRSELLGLRTGEIQWLAQDGEEVEEGAAVALSGAQQIRQSENQLTLDEAALPLKLKEAEWNHGDKTAGLERQVEELEGRITKLSLTPKERKLLGDELSRRLADERLKLEADLVTMAEKLDFDFLAEGLRVEQEQIRQDLERARTEHADLVRSMEIPAPHDGVLHILKSGDIRTSDLIGTVERRGKASVTLQLFDPELRSEVPESLSITVSSPTGEMLPGRFSKIEQVPGARVGPAIYHFTLDDSPENPLREEISGERMVTIYKLLASEARIVPKTGFLFSHPAEVQRHGWAGFLREIWPDARIVHVGPRSIALSEQE